ncbi:UNVERIFIED_CONTAM: hypothetical protein NCL1_23212 [Trichonephila clavipes]
MNKPMNFYTSAFDKVQNVLLKVHKSIFNNVFNCFKSSLELISSMLVLMPSSGVYFLFLSEIIVII